MINQQPSAIDQYPGSGVNVSPPVTAIRRARGMSKQPLYASPEAITGQTSAQAEPVQSTYNGQGSGSRKPGLAPTSAVSPGGLPYNPATAKLANPANAKFAPKPPGLGPATRGMPQRPVAAPIIKPREEM